ncbi:unnamed protein product [Miscanthus lutarioriparius]|uniref:F-box domain-containing protein n=1 Tax=Miscanthus lutarioriparius TaxID=422564 RepID=A0A811R4V1_9POAL|nr:unnamed protein product [Miscanthus lutarioriparius]
MEMEEPPPPPPTLRAPPALPDELVEEVLLRSPPDDPAHLVRAALVCKRWSRLVSDLAFRPRFRDFQLQGRGAPMLGFLRNMSAANEPISARFVRTSASCRPSTPSGAGSRSTRARPRPPPLRRRRRARLPRPLRPRRRAFLGIRLAIWDPLSAAAGGHLELPVPVLPRRPRSWLAALLCDQHGLLDHADGHFRVVLVGTDSEGTFACVYYSLGPAAWSEPVYTAQHPDPGAGGGYVDAVRGALVGNALYFLFQWRTSILKYDLATGDVSFIRLPLASHNGRMLNTVLTTTEDGGLGFARVAVDKLCLWSMEPRPNGGALAMEWTQGRVIDLRSLLPVIDLLGYADGVGMILVGTIGGCFSVDQKSGRIDKLVDGTGFCRDIVPYMSFYTPALGTASTNEGPSVNA